MSGKDGKRKDIVPFILTVACIVLAIDQYTKFWIRSTFVEGLSRPVLPGIFHLTFITNRGSAFGLFPGGGKIFIFLSIFTIIFLLILSWKKRYTLSFLARFPFGLILGGVSGNLIDRIRFGAVIDFIDFRVWPIFNIADSGITIGVILLSLHLFKRQHASRTV